MLMWFELPLHAVHLRLEESYLQTSHLQWREHEVNMLKGLQNFLRGTKQFPFILIWWWLHPVIEQRCISTLNLVSSSGLYHFKTNQLKLEVRLFYLTFWLPTVYHLWYFVVCQYTVNNEVVLWLYAMKMPKSKGDLRILLPTVSNL